jgi:flagellar basal body P-ring formation protein FlgA
MRSLVMMLCLCGLLMPVYAFGKTVVDLKGEVAITGNIVKLSDLAEISGDDASLLSSIAIAKSPGGSFDLNISARTIETKIRSRYLGVIVFTGATLTHVVSCTVEVPEEVLKKIFIEEILKNSPWKETGRIEVVDVRISRLPKVLQADSNIIRAKFSSYERYLGFTTATMLIGSGMSPEKVTVTGKVKLVADIPAVRAKVAAGRVITTSDLMMRPIDISSCPNAYTRLEDCVGKRAKITLREGYPILPAQLERKPDVLIGETVVIQARIDNIIVRDKGIAMKDGYMNEPIPVKNVSSGRKVLGTIIAASLVQVEL